MKLLSPSRLAATFFVLVISAVAAYLLIGPTKPNQPTTSRHRIRAEHKPFEFKRPLEQVETSFRVDWPPKTPDDGRRSKSPPLLSGKLIVLTGQQRDKTTLNVRIELTRADSEPDRTRWNRQLRFPEYDWMSKVRTWDEQRQWLWPNLPYLLRAHGTERDQRYGGVDPGKGIDNDFAAVVLKPLDAEEDKSELIAGEWHPPPVGWVDKRTIVHRAVSEDLQRTIPDSKRSSELGVWLIYADFLDFAPPRSWPDEPEFDGGILAYFSIHWKRADDGAVEIVSVQNEVPITSTGVDWEAWLASVRNSANKARNRNSSRDLNLMDSRWPPPVNTNARQ